MFIDTHCHYYDGFTPQEADEAIGRAIAAGVGRMIQADVDSESRPLMREITDRQPSAISEMIGIYPGNITENWKDELDRMIQDYDPTRPIVAVGEIGLDYHEGKEYAELQKEAFRIQLELAAKWDLPVNIHLRDATEDFVKIIKDCRGLGIRGNMHCFSASYETWAEVNRYADLMVGIGGVITFKKASLPETVSHIPLDRILMETDTPYLAPSPYRGKRNESSYIPEIAKKIAEVKGIGLDEVENVTSANATKLFFNK